MAVFNFRLQSILDYRRSLVDQLRTELAGLQLKCQQEENEVAALEAAEWNAINALATTRQESVDMSQALQVEERLALVQKSIALQTEVVERIRAQIEGMREDLLELTKESKALEKLRERHQEEFVRDGQRLERIDTSDLGALQFRRSAGPRQ